MSNKFLIGFKQGISKGLSPARIAEDLVKFFFVTINIKLIGWIGFLSACDLPSATWHQAVGIAFFIILSARGG
jgi:hypothetical protein